MFSIVKILNSGASTPDVLRLPISRDVATERGCALVIKDGALACPAEGDKPELIVIDRTSEDCVTAFITSPEVVYRMKPLLKTEEGEDGELTVETAPAILERVGIATQNGIAVDIKKSEIGAGTVIGTEGDCLLVIFR